MSDETDNETTSNDQDAPLPVEPEEYPVDRLKSRIGGVLAGRPLAVYLVLMAGAATLIILLIIVWISATGSTNQERPICTIITISDARNAVLAGHVRRIAVLVDADKPADTLTGINLDFDDGSCRATIQGADHRDELYLFLGAVTYYNNFAENRVRVEYQKQVVQPELLSTSTPTPTATEPSKETETPTSSPAAEGTALPTVEPTETVTLATEPSATETVATEPSATAALTPTRTPAVTATATIRLEPAATRGAIRTPIP